MGKVWMAGGDADNAATATKLATPRSIIIDLGSLTAKYFDGSANITPGVKGVLSIANGGTGAATASGALEALGVLIELAKYLPLTGGTLSSDLCIKMKSGNPAYTFVREENNSQAYIVKTVDNMQIALRNVYGDGSNERRFYLYDNTTDLKNAVRFYDVVTGSGKLYDLFGSHNKPSGTYSGNGSATSRTINTGGIGRWIIIDGNGYIGIICAGAGIFFNASSSSTPTTVTNDKIKYSEGTLTIADTSAMFNGNGKRYTYYCL